MTKWPAKQSWPGLPPEVGQPQRRVYSQEEYENLVVSWRWAPEGLYITQQKHAPAQWQGRGVDRQPQATGPLSGAKRCASDSMICRNAYGDPRTRLQPRPHG